MTRQITTCDQCGGEKHTKYATGKGNRGVSFIEKTHPVVICDECGLVFLNPQHSEEDYAKYYSGLNVTRINVEQTLQIVRNPHNSRVAVRDFVLKNVDTTTIGSAPSLLDVGCGRGIFLYLMDKAGYDVTGLESGTVEVDFIRNNLGLKVYNSFITNHNIPGETFDVVTSMGVIEHVNSPRKFLYELWKLIKPGGYVLITTPNIRMLNLRYGEESWFKFVHTYYFSEKTLKSVMKLSGFDIVDSMNMEPIYKKSRLFGKVSASGGGSVCVIGKKREIRSSDTYEKDDVRELLSVIKEARKSFFWQYTYERGMRYLKAMRAILSQKKRVRG